MTKTSETKWNCTNCKNWTPTKYGFGQHGVCSVIKDKIDVDITYGWDGGYINHIETEANFGCNQFEEK